MPNNTPTPQELVGLIADDPLLSSIKRSLLDELQDDLSWVALGEGETLFNEGDAVDAFYFVINGLLEVTTVQEDTDGNPENDRLLLAEIGPGATIGEMQILTGGVRSATVSAAQASGLVKFPKAAFDTFLAKDQAVVDELAKTIMPRLYRDQMVDVLPKLFGEFDEEMLHDLESKMTWRSLRRGDLLCFQGEPSDSFYIIISGRMQVLIKDATGRSRQVAEMSQGESVGEMGVFTGEPRSATIVASRDSELLEFSKDEFEEFTRQYPELMRRMTRLLINRLQRVTRESPGSEPQFQHPVGPCQRQCAAGPRRQTAVRSAAGDGHRACRRDGDVPVAHQPGGGQSTRFAEHLAGGRSPARRSASAVLVERAREELCRPASCCKLIRRPRTGRNVAFATRTRSCTWLTRNTSP